MTNVAFRTLLQLTARLIKAFLVGLQVSCNLLTRRCHCPALVQVSFLVLILSASAMQQIMSQDMRHSIGSPIVTHIWCSTHLESPMTGRSCGSLCSIALRFGCRCVCNTLGRICACSFRVFQQTESEEKMLNPAMGVERS